MGKINTLFKILKTIGKDPRSLLRLVDNEEAEGKLIAERKYNLPLGLPMIDILDLFPDLNETVNPYTYLLGTSIPTDLILLKKLAMRFDNCEYLEIGTWRGESVANVSPVAGHCTTFNLPDEKMRAIGCSQRYLDLIGFFSKDLKNVTQKFEDSLEYDFSAYHKKIDLVFVDGDHHYSSVKKDTETAFKLLKDENSIIVWHDYSFHPEKIRWGVMAAILDGAPPEFRDNIYYVSNTLCAIYMNEKVKSRFLNYPEIPDKVFEVTIKAKRL